MLWHMAYKDMKCKKKIAWKHYTSFYNIYERLFGLAKLLMSPYRKRLDTEFTYFNDALANYPLSKNPAIFDTILRTKGNRGEKIRTTTTIY